MATDAKAPRDEQESQILKDAMSFVIGKSMPLPKQWAGEDLDKLEFPNDLTVLTSEQLGEVLGVWTSVMGYAQFETARADIQRTARWNRLEIARKEKYLELTVAKEFTEEGKKAKVHVHTAKLLKDYEEAKAAYTLMNALLGVYSKYYQALSRELSRRGLVGVERGLPESDGDGLEDDIERGREKLTKDWKRDG